MTGRTDAVRFLDKSDLAGGDAFADVITDALASSRTLLAIVTPAYVKSTWCGQEWHSSANDRVHSQRLTPAFCRLYGHRFATPCQRSLPPSSSPNLTPSSYAAREGCVRYCVIATHTTTTRRSCDVLRAPSLTSVAAST